MDKHEILKATPGQLRAWIALAEKDESAPRWGAGGWEETS